MINVEERKVIRKPKDAKINESKEEPSSQANIQPTTELEAYTRSTDSAKDHSPKEEAPLNTSNTKQEENKKEELPLTKPISILDCMVKNMKDVYQ